jgi:hypothetical protein
MSFRIPKDGTWVQTNNSERLGSIYASKGIDLTDNVGSLRMAPRLLINTSSSEDADLGLPWGFKYYNSQWWAGAGAYMFKQASPDGSADASFTQDAVSGTPTICSSDRSDIAVFNGNLYVSGSSTSLYKFNTSAWSTVTLTGSGSADTKMMEEYGNRLYVTFGAGSYRVTSIDTSDAMATMGTSYTVSVDPKYRITFIRRTSEGLWLGCLNVNNGKGAIYFWNGQQTTPNLRYDLNSNGVVAGAVDKDVLYAIDVNGNLLYYNGGGFTEVAQLPIPKDRYLFSPVDSDNGDRFVHPNGMSATEGIVRILVNGRVFDSAQSSLEVLPSGIWEYSKGNGLVHKHLPTYTAKGTTTITDYGQSRIRYVGALTDAKSIGQNVSKGSLLAGLTYHYDGSTSTRNAIFLDDNNETVQKYGWIIIPQMLSSSFTETWLKAVPRFRKLLGSTDSITVKHRVDKTDPVQISLTWLNTSSFTTTTDLSSMVGYEVEVLNGTGAGKCAHIVTVTGSGTYTIALDDTFAGVTTGTAVAHVTQWFKDGTYSSQADNYAEFALGEESTLVSVKICMQITGKWDLYDLFMVNSSDKQVK